MSSTFDQTAPRAPDSTRGSDPLVDGFGRRHTYLRLSLTERCNLRCRYCMPAEGIPLKHHDRMLTFEEMERLARLLVGAGVRKIRLTGGEPLVRKGAVDLAAMLGRIPNIEKLAITTNGLLLERFLPGLVKAGVTAMNISLDTLHADRFEEITRRPGLQTVLDAIDLALAAGYRPLKINCVVMRGMNDDEIGDFINLTRDRPLDVRFIEFMPFAGNQWGRDRLVPYTEMIERARKSAPDIRPVDEDPHRISKQWKIPGAAGTVGFITSMSEHFCAGCSRIRITADGNLKVCLFGHSELSLRDMIRAGASDAELLDAVGTALDGKKAAHAGMTELAEGTDRPMILIGG